MSRGTVSELRNLRASPAHARKASTADRRGHALLELRNAGRRRNTAADCRVAIEPQRRTWVEDGIALDAAGRGHVWLLRKVKALDGIRGAGSVWMRVGVAAGTQGKSQNEQSAVTHYCTKTWQL
jgi:hypothetical protein